MPIVNGVEVLENYTAVQFEELVQQLNYMSLSYKSVIYNGLVISSPILLFSNQSVTASGTVRNTTAADTGNCSKVQITYSLTGTSTSCVLNIYGTSHSDLSNASVLATLTLAAGGTPVTCSIDPLWIPKYTFAELVNTDSTVANAAIGTVEMVTWT